MAKDASMKYIVITSKHHDGFALFDSKASKWDIIDATPYGKDLLKPVAEACRKYGIKLGFYYSQAQDWNNPGGAAARKVASEGWANPDSSKIDAYTEANSGHWDPAQTTKTMAPVSYTHLRAHETPEHLVCRLLLEKKTMLK